MTGIIHWLTLFLRDVHREGVAMLVQQILKSKGGGGVITVTPDTPVSEATSILA